MSQVSVCSATAQGRSPWRALRPVLVLGGFVAVWWALMTGVAQADSTPQHSLVDQVRSQVKAQHHSEHRATPVRDAVRRVQHDVKAQTTKSAPKVRHQVRELTRPVTKTVSSAVDSTPLAPVTKKATETIRTTTSKTLATTRALLAKTAAGPAIDSVVDPVLGTVQDTVADTAENAESSTGQGNSHTPRPSSKASRISFAELFSSASGQQSLSSAAPARAGASTDADQPLDGPRGTPSVPDPCASPSGSGSSSHTPVGVTESSWLGTPSVLRDLRTWRLARLPSGPAYQPGSSPD